MPASGRSAPDGQVPTINLELVADAVSSEAAAGLERSAYGVIVSEEPAPAVRPSALESPSEDPGPHLSYAVQWILFAIMGFVFIGYVIHTERARRHEDADAVAPEDEKTDAAPAARERAHDSGPAPDAASAPSAEPRRRKRDRDAEDEDAILDAAGR